MKKKKDGTVIASLTEVKNKTGDIFALADEFGEVILTSYNKPRYKIVKMDISDVLNLSEESETKSEPKAQNKKDVNVATVAIPAQEKPELIDKLINISEWNRNNSQESEFTNKATKSLLN